MDILEKWAATEGATIKESKQSTRFRIDRLGMSILAPKPNVSLNMIANTLYESDFAIIVVDSTEGPLPHNREHIIVARQARVPVMSVLFANVDRLYSLAPQDARQLLKLEQEEIRLLLSSYEVGGHNSLLFHDSTSATRSPRTAVGGLSKLGPMLSKPTATRQPGKNSVWQQKAAAQVYFLTNEEAAGRAITLNGPTTLQIWSEGSTSTVDLAAPDTVRPGEVAEVRIEAKEAFSAYSGSRIMLMKDDHVLGMGVVTEASTFSP